MVKVLAFINVVYSIQTLAASYAFSSYPVLYIAVRFLTIIFELHVL